MPSTPATPPTPAVPPCPAEPELPGVPAILSEPPPGIIPAAPAATGTPPDPDTGSAVAPAFAAWVRDAPPPPRPEELVFSVAAPPTESLQDTKSPAITSKAGSTRA